MITTLNTFHPLSPPPPPSYNFRHYNTFIWHSSAVKASKVMFCFLLYIMNVGSLNKLYIGKYE